MLNWLDRRRGTAPPTAAPEHPRARHTSDCDRQSSALACRLALSAAAADCDADVARRREELRHLISHWVSINQRGGCGATIGEASLHLLISGSLGQSRWPISVHLELRRLVGEETLHLLPRRPLRLVGLVARRNPARLGKVRVRRRPLGGARWRTLTLGPLRQQLAHDGRRVVVGGVVDDLGAADGVAGDAVDEDPRAGRGDVAELAVDLGMVRAGVSA